MASIVPVRLAYKVFNPSSGVDGKLVPVVFLHGLTLCKEYWGDIPQKVADVTKRKVYAIDARNHGDTEWSNYFNFEIVVDDFIHFLESHDLRKAILVGHSMGAITSIKVALKRPDLVDKIIIEDTFVQKVPVEIIQSVLVYLSLYRKAMADVPSGLDEKGVKKYAIRYIIDNLPEEMGPLKESINEKDFDYVVHLRRNESGGYTHKANLDVLEKALSNTETLMKDIEGLYEGPALFIYGKKSPFLVGAEEQIRPIFPNALFDEIEDAGHLTHIEKPEEFTDSILNFLS